MTDVIAERAAAKVNLYLHITGRRDDGYHLLDSLFVFADLHDRLEAAPAEDLTLVADGPFAAGLPDDPARNHVLLAARALAAEAGISPRAALRLTKVIPVASGIGGGSADAAATLRALNRLWDLGWNDERLAAIGLGIGADVPAAVASRPVRVRGVGEVLEPLGDMPRVYMTLVNPRQPVSTAAVFGCYSRSGAPFRAPAELRIPEDAAGLISGLHALGNDLEAAAAGIAPAILRARAALAASPGCALARMSGSGATCFGLFPDPEDAQFAAAELAARHGWWTWSGGLAPVETVL